MANTENALTPWLHIGQGIGMDRLVVRGGRSLSGEITIGGSKNASLPILAAALLCPETLSLRNMPKLSDVSSMLQLLLHLGCDVKPESDGLNISTASLATEDAPYELVRKMRTSILVLGPLLGRFGKAKVSLPGGCAIGARPIDIHLNGLQKLGAVITLEQGYVTAEVPNGRLIGAEIDLSFASVGATQNLMMAAVLAEGVTVIRNIAQEPEINQLADCLKRMGAKIRFEGDAAICITGVEALHGAEYTVETDRIQAGSYAMMVAATGGSAFLHGMDLTHLGQAKDVMHHAGVIMSQDTDGVHVKAGEIRALDVVTAPFPGFPTDLQAQLMALLCVAKGRSSISEKIFENRFMHVPELQRLGADITLVGDTALINVKPYQDRPRLMGAEVMATDLRASFCLIMLGLLAEGTTLVQRLYHLDRGYEGLAEKLHQLGADIERGDVNG